MSSRTRKRRNALRKHPPAPIPPSATANAGVEFVTCPLLGPPDYNRTLKLNDSIYAVLPRYVRPNPISEEVHDVMYRYAWQVLLQSQDTFIPLLEKMQTVAGLHALRQDAVGLLQAFWENLAGPLPGELTLQLVPSEVTAASIEGLQHYFGVVAPPIQVALLVCQLNASMPPMQA